MAVTVCVCVRVRGGVVAGARTAEWPTPLLPPAPPTHARTPRPGPRPRPPRQAEDPPAGRSGWRGLGPQEYLMWTCAQGYKVVKLGEGGSPGGELVVNGLPFSPGSHPSRAARYLLAAATPSFHRKPCVPQFQCLARPFAADGCHSAGGGCCS